MSKKRTIIINIKEAEKTCLEFIKAQGNYSNAIKYLILKEVHENGIKNLSKFIPEKISDDFFTSDSFNKVNISKEKHPSVKSNTLNENSEKTSKKEDIPKTDIIKKFEGNTGKIKKIEDKKNIIEKTEEETLNIEDIDIPSCYL